MNAESEETVTETEAAAEASASTGAVGDESLEQARFEEVTGSEALGEVDPSKNMELLQDVSLRARVELGRSEMYLKDIMRLAEGSVVELDKHSGDPLDIFVSGRLVARGEVLVLNDSFCVRVTEILSPEECFKVKAD